ncbi:YfbR-like 5'-deoxynucleotidase [Bacillus toyonensis]|uniref:YfbR-like 5'-deoxynucleotidase n=1 Tax=Bacillus toyonensis TaxID=155322 RepID=UPI002E1A895E|nr:HD domain-containing protein [Bacillus toyonensis]
MTQPKNSELFHILMKLPIIERFGDFSPRYQDSTASHSYRVAVLSLLIGLTENIKYKRDLDLAKIVCRAVFHDVNEVITGSIKHNTKKNEIVGDLIKEIEKEASESIVDFLSPSLQKYFYDYIVLAEDSTPEGRIVKLADTMDALLFSVREQKAYNRYEFPRVQKESKKELMHCEFESIKEMVDVLGDSQSKYHKFLMYILKLDEIDRWSLQFNTYKDQDATHTFRCAALGIFFAHYEQEKHGTELDIQRLVGKILFHDLAETITGDIPAPLKHKNKRRSEAFAKYEESVAEDFVSWAPEHLKLHLEDYLINAKDDTPEGIRVDIVDKIDALMKSQLEMNRGSRVYEEKFKGQVGKLQKKYFENPGVQFFLATILHDLYFESEFVN